MKIIFKIAKKELQLLFYSPVAWVMMILLILQASMIMMGKYEVLLQGVERGYRLRPISMDLFQKGLWSMVQNYMYYYVPLLTMGLVSTELHTGSIKLLYSSPITNRQIILGKFLSMIAYAGMLCGVLLVYIILGWFTIENFELSAILVGLLGTFLLICTYSAIGIFISSLTAYQFVAALGSFIVLALLSFVGGLWQEYDFVRDITYWLRINGRIDTFARGMICSEDVLYFLTVTALFLSLAIIRLNAVRQKIPFRITLQKNVVVILIACLVGYFSSRPSLMFYGDATSNKENTLTEVSQEVVAQLKGGLSITGYSNLLDMGSYPYSEFPGFIQSNRELFKRYVRFKPETKLDVVYYYDTVTPQDSEIGAQLLLSYMENGKQTLEQRAKSEFGTRGVDEKFFLTPKEIREKIDLEGERGFVWQITRKDGRSAWLRTFRDNLRVPSEAEITAALKRLTMKVPTIGFVSGHGTRSIHEDQPREYYAVAGNKHRRSTLINQGFDVVDVDLSKGIPEEVDILMIADIRDVFSSEEEAKIQQFSDRGGNFFILAEPKRREVVNPFLNRLFGWELGEGTLVQYVDVKMGPDVLCSVYTPEAHALSSYYTVTPMVCMPTAGWLREVKNKGYSNIPLLKTATQIGRQKVDPAWNELESLNWKEEQLQYNPAAGEEMQEYTTAVALSRKVGEKEQRIVLIGDADCISNNEMIQERSMYNYLLYMGATHYLSYGEMPIDVTRSDTNDKHILFNREGFNWMKIAFYGVFPSIFFLLGLFIYIRRRGR